jgi:cytidylate kinase
VAQALAKRLGFVYVNSGAMYRAVTWHVMEHGVDPSDSKAVAQLIDDSEIDCDLVNRESRIRINGIDPSEHLRDLRVNSEVSQVSTVPRVREVLVARMHAYARDHDVVMEGRDIGSVVFPQTPYKFYIDAAPEIRAERRAAQGQNDRVADRDRFDSSRRAAPLMIAEDARVIDSSNLSIEGVVNRIVELLQARGIAAPAPQAR